MYFTRVSAVALTFISRNNQLVDLDQLDVGMKGCRILQRIYIYIYLYLKLLRLTSHKFCRK